MRKKGQAAMEFLMTYGWAILAAIIVIGVLAVYFKPSSLGANNALIGQPLYAQVWGIDSGNNLISLDIKNNGLDTYNITSFAVTGTGSSTNNCANTAVGVQIAAGEIATITSIGCSPLFEQGDSYTGDIIIKYTLVGGGTSQVSSGTISATAAD